MTFDKALAKVLKGFTVSRADDLSDRIYMRRDPETGDLAMGCGSISGEKGADGDTIVWGNSEVYAEDLDATDWKVT